MAAGAPRMRDATWVRPRLVAQVEFTEWTDDGKLRHPSFQGLRADKLPEECIRETPAAPGTKTPTSTSRPSASSSGYGGCTVTHTNPSPAAIPTGLPPTLIVLTTLPATGSMRDTVPSFEFATQIAPSP